MVQKFSLSCFEFCMMLSDKGAEKAACHEQFGGM